MKRPTRVPASRVVRMKSASNMIAKWYQSAFSAGPPRAWEKSPPCRRRGSARRRCAESSAGLPTPGQALEGRGVEGEAPAR